MTQIQHLRIEKTRYSDHLKYCIKIFIHDTVYLYLDEYLLSI